MIATITESSHWPQAAFLISIVICASWIAVTIIKAFK